MIKWLIVELQIEASSSGLITSLTETSCYRLTTKGRWAHKKSLQAPPCWPDCFALEIYHFCTLPLTFLTKCCSVLAGSPFAGYCTTVYIGTYYIVIIKELFYCKNWTQTCWKLKLSPCNKNNSKVFGIASCQLECAPCIIFRYSPVTKGHNYHKGVYFLYCAGFAHNHSLNTLLNIALANDQQMILFWLSYNGV